MQTYVCMCLAGSVNILLDQRGLLALRASVQALAVYACHVLPALPDLTAMICVWLCFKALRARADVLCCAHHSACVCCLNDLPI